MESIDELNRQFSELEKLKIQERDLEKEIILLTQELIQIFRQLYPPLRKVDQLIISPSVLSDWLIQRYKEG